MKKAVVIGGSGHIGTYLIPELYERGYDITVISRGNTGTYNPELPVWDKIKRVKCDRLKMAAEGKFGTMVAEMKPDLIFDTVSYTRETMEELCNPIMADSKLSEKTKIVQIGSIWVYGYKVESPVEESHVHNAICDYGRGKTDIEVYLRELSEAGKLNTTVLHPGHISGEGWYPINPQANFNETVYADIIAGKELLLPNDGNATIHHVHAADIAGLTMAVLDNPDASCGQAFNATSKHAVTLRGFAERLYEHFGHEPKLLYLPYEEFAKKISPEDAADTFDHIRRSPNCSMEKAEKLLGFVPKYSSIDTVISALNYKIERGEL